MSEHIKLKDGTETIHVFKNFLDYNLCDYYFKQINDLGPGVYDWDVRSKDITKDKKIVNKVRKFLCKQLNIDLEIDQVQLQNWNVGSRSGFHRHQNREGDGVRDTALNSLIYLNDDFEGGEFITPNNSYKPNKGDLTFFNGYTLWHGVNEVLKKDRKTIIFWWE